jgi:ATP/maltotriose-dependent transcriptional regulator MalT
LAELNNDLIRGADYRYALARVRSEKFQFRAAIALGSAVYAKYVSVGDPQVTSLLNDLAHWYTQLEEYDEALSFTQKALAQCPAINLALRATLALTIAEIQIKKGDVTEAKRYLDLSKRLSAEFEIGFDFQAGMRLTSAEIKLADGDKEGSLVMLSALAAERDGQSYNFASAVRKSYVKALRLDGQIEKANQLERESAVIKRDFFRRQSDQRYQLARLQDRVNELIANWHQREAAFISGAG